MTTQRALITGASSGLGKALVLEMANEGYEVILVGRDQKKLNDVINEAPTEVQKRMRGYCADLSSDHQVLNLWARCQSLFGDSRPIDLLINCAGYAVTGRVEDIPIEDFERCWKVNFSSAVSLVQQALPSMRASGQGIIVNVGSGVARRSLPFTSPYCAAKAALLSFTDSLRVEVAPENITVLLFSPGPVASGFHDATVHRGSHPMQFPAFHGQPAEKIARVLIRAIKARKTRVVLGGRASVAHHLNYWFPRFTDWLIGRMYRVGESSVTATEVPPHSVAVSSLRGPKV